jgi:hypothetical protein
LIPSEPRLSTSIVIDLDDNDDGIFEIPSEPPGLGSASIVMDIDDDDGVDEIPSEPPRLASCLSTSIADGVVDHGTLSEPTGRDTCLMSSSIDDGIGTDPGEQYKQVRGFEIPRGYEADGIDETPPSKPPGRSFCVSTSIEDDVIALDEDGGIEFLVADDSRVPTPYRRTYSTTHARECS